MSISISGIGEKTKDLIVVDSPMARVLMHDTSGVVLTDDNSFITEAMTVQGTTTNIWSANPGWFTSAGDNYMNIAAGGTPENLMQLDNIGDGAVLVLSQYKAGAIPISNDYLYSYGSVFGGSNGFALRFRSNSKLTAGYRSIANAPIDVTSTGTYSATSEIFLAHYLCPSDNIISLYANGVAFSGSFPDTNYVSSNVFTTFGYSTTASFQASAQMRDLTIIRFATKPSAADLETIINKFKDEPHELPWALDNH